MFCYFKILRHRKIRIGSYHNVESSFLIRKCRSQLVLKCYGYFFKITLVRIKLNFATLGLGFMKPFCLCSVTLSSEQMHAKTTVTASPDFKQDNIWLNKELQVIIERVQCTQQSRKLVKIGGQCLNFRQNTQVLKIVKFWSQPYLYSRYLTS